MCINYYKKCIVHYNIINTIYFFTQLQIKKKKKMVGNIKYKIIKIILKQSFIQLQLHYKIINIEWLI